MSSIILTFCVIIGIILPYVITNFLIPKIINFGHNRNIIDLPSARKQHNKPVVRLGGLALSLGVSLSVIFVCLILYAFEIFNEFALQSNLKIIFASFLMFLIGISDDLYNLSPKIRLFFQVAVVSIVWTFGFQIENINLLFDSSLIFQLSNVLSYLFILFWVVGVTNSINWIDGLDGLAIGSVIVSSSFVTAIEIITGNYVFLILSIALLSSSLAFLKFNRYPAKVYMGDGGSYFLGSLLACTALISSSSNFNFDSYQLNIIPFIPLLIIFLPILDMTLVIFERIKNGYSPFYPDRRHLHHKLLKLGYSHRNTVKIIYLFSILFCSLSFFFLEFRPLYLFPITSCIFIYLKFPKKKFKS